jgi:hypothetical protein
MMHWNILVEYENGVKLKNEVVLKGHTVGESTESSPNFLKGFSGKRKLLVLDGARMVMEIYDPVYKMHWKVIIVEGHEYRANTDRLDNDPQFEPNELHYQRLYLTLEGDDV